MLLNARQILVSELALAEDSSVENIEEQVDTRINDSFLAYKVEAKPEENIVKKFIPFDS